MVAILVREVQLEGNPTPCENPLMWQALARRPVLEWRFCQRVVLNFRDSPRALARRSRC